MQKEELIAKLKEAKSADEILVLAKENGIELSEEKAKELFSELNATGELSDEDLDKVAGGNIFEKSEKNPRRHYEIRNLAIKRQNDSI